MADEVKDVPTDQPAKSGIRLFPLINTVLIFATLGMLTYTKILYKKPEITEAKEREKLAKQHEAPPKVLVPGMVTFDAVTVTIAPSARQKVSSDPFAHEVKGKIHYATIAFAMEIKDVDKKEFLQAAKPLIQDLLLTLLGRKQFQELTTVQGRYLLQAELIDAINLKLGQTVPELKNEDLVSHIFFTQFIVQ